MLLTQGNAGHSRAGSAAFRGTLPLLRGSIYPLGGFFLGVRWEYIAGSPASPAYASIVSASQLVSALQFQKLSLLVTHFCPSRDTPPPPAGSRVLTVPFWPLCRAVVQPIGPHTNILVVILKYFLTSW